MTLYTYIQGIPAANNDPSVDQPNMETNTNSAFGIISTDHVGYNTYGPVGAPNGAGGQHLQVTFNGQNVPGSFPVPLPVLFTKDDAFSLPQLQFYSGTQAQSQNQYVASANGSTFALGGILLKWGSFTTVAGTFAVTFSPVFNHACFSVVLTPIQAFTAGYYVTTITSTGFTAFNQGGGAVAFNYIAIGN